MAMKKTVILSLLFFMLTIAADSVKYQCNNCREYVARWWTWNVCVDSLEFKINLCSVCTKLPKCSECYGRVSEYQHIDKRYFCKECKVKGVFAKTQGQKIFDSTRKFLKERWGIYTDHKIYFSLEDADFMKQFSNNYSNNWLGYFSPLGSGGKIRYSSGVEYDRPKVFRIRVMSGLSPKKLASIIAHELTHDWVWECVPQILKFERLNEGMATFIQWLYLKEIGECNMAKRQESCADLVYGAGFRQMQQIMINCKNAKDFKVVLLKQSN